MSDKSAGEIDTSKIETKIESQIESQIESWSGKVLRGDPQAVSRAITAVENRSAEGRALLRRLFPHTGRATLVGITGASGAGKSTLVGALTAELRKQGKTVGILAIDPSSPVTGGAILGDRIRMQEHTGDPGTFIRSMATRGALGGLAPAALDAALVLDASGKDYVLVETVGAGQDEVDVAKLADVTVVVMVPGLGDDIQAFKAGIMEIADVFAINKADLPGADRVEQEIEALLSLAPASNEWRPPVIRTVATTGAGASNLLAAVARRMAFSSGHESSAGRRRALWRARLLEILREHLLRDVLRTLPADASLDAFAASVTNRAEDPYSAVERILEQAGWSAVKKVAGTGAPVLDHLGVAVESLPLAVQFYQRTLGMEVAGFETIEHEKTRVAMLPAGDCRIELLEATEPDSPIARFLAKRGAGLHHICLRVPDLAAAIARLKDARVEFIHSEPQIGAGGHRYVFVHPRSTGGVLLELVEAGPH
jgi:LAO/AO transport system kinase